MKTSNPDPTGPRPIPPPNPPKAGTGLMDEVELLRKWIAELREACRPFVIRNTSDETFTIEVKSSDVSDLRRAVTHPSDRG